MNAETAQINSDTATPLNKSRISGYLLSFGVYLRCRFLVLASLLFPLGCGDRDDLHGGGDAPKVVQVPDTARIRVEIINTTTQRGLARRAMFFLRDQGFDVVRFASGAPPRDSTQVVDRTGHSEWAQLVARALGVARVVADVDSTRYLDVSVYLGRDWRPPAKPFYP
ncbi:MAG: LytR C-terminal domain-containing protein [Gemmatimonadaceae bacterium]